MAIRTFADKRLARAFRNDDYRKVHPSLRRRVRATLSDLNQARCLRDMALPRYRLHPLTADLSGFHSIRLGRLESVIFRFEDANAYDVRLVDYHWTKAPHAQSVPPRREHPLRLPR